MPQSDGIRTPNLPIDDGGTAIEVLVHTDLGNGARGLRRQTLGVFVQAVLAAAGVANQNEPIVLAVLQNRGFTVDGNGKLHLTELEAKVVAEETRANAAELGLMQNIAQEANRATGAEAALGGRIDGEAAARAAADTALGGRVDGEAAARAAADTALVGRVDGEAAARAAADTALGGRVDGEAAARAAADTALGGRVDAEAAARAAADTALGGRVDAEAAARAAADTALGARISVVDVKTDRALASSTIAATTGRPMLGDSYTSAVGAKRWGVGAVVDRPRRAVSFTARGSGFNAVASILVRVISRGRSDVDLNVASPGGASTDIEVFNGTLAIAALGLDGTLAGAQDFTVALDGMPTLSPDRIYFLDWTGLAANGSPVAIGCATGTSQEALTPQWSRGYYQLLNNNFTVMPGEGNQTVFFDLLTETGVAQEDADFARREVAGSPSSGDSYSATANFFTGWGIGVETSRRFRPSRLYLRSDGLNNVTSIRLRVYQRATGQQDIGSGGATPGAAGSDRLKATITTPITETGANPTTAAWQDYSLSLDKLPVLRPGFVYFFEWEALTAQGAVTYLGSAIGMPFSAPVPTYLRGYYLVGGNKVALSDLGNVTVYFRLEERQSVRDALREASAKLDSRPSYGAPSLDRVVIYDEPLIADQAMPYLRIPRLRLRTAKGDLLIPAQPIVCQPIATDAVTDPNVTISFGGRAFLKRQYVSAVSAKRNSDNVALVLGIDYQINKETGRIYGLKDVASFVATVTCTGRKHRYDLIYADPITGMCDIFVGQNRAWEPEEYRPTCPPGKIPLFAVYVYGTDPVHRAEIIPICEYESGVRLDEKADNARLMDYNRNALARFFGKCARGGKVYVANYSDSIRTLGGSAQNQLIPNFDRDLVGWYFPRYEQDTIDSIQPRFSNEYGTNLHVYVGDMWYFLRALEAKHPQASIDYLNFGVSGTTTANTLSGGLYNALHPDRLNALFGVSPVGPKPDLVVIGFGMNELGTTATYANVRALIQRAKTEGADVLVTTPVRFNDWDPVSTIANWRYTTDALIQAAKDEGVAYLSFDKIEGPGREGAVGLSAKTAGQTGAYNHPGRAQETGHGRLLASLVGGPDLDLPITRNGYGGQPAKGRSSADITDSTVTGRALVTTATAAAAATTLGLGTGNTPIFAGLRTSTTASNVEVVVHEAGESGYVQQTIRGPSIVYAAGFQGTANGYVGMNSGHALHLRTAATARIIIKDTGEVGVGKAPVTGVAMDVSGAVGVGSFTVATLPTAGIARRAAWASNGRAYNGAGTLEGAGAGTGCLVTDNGTAWKIAGTNQTVQA